MIKHIKKTIILACLFFAGGVLASEKDSDQQSVDNFMSTIKDISKAIGITDPKAYLHAAHTYIYISGGQVQREFKLLSELDSYNEYILYAQSDNEIPMELTNTLMTEVKQQKSNFAQQLGLDVSLFDRFIDVYTKLSEHGRYGDIVVDGYYEKAKQYQDAINVNQLERVIVKCRKNCNDEIYKNSQWLNLHVSSLAANRGIGETILHTSDNPFIVEFRDNKDKIVRVEGWRKNDFIGGWKYTELKCEQCEHEDLI